MLSSYPSLDDVYLVKSFIEVESYHMCSYMSGFFKSAQCFLYLSILLHESVVYSLSLLHSIPLHRYMDRSYFVYIHSPIGGHFNYFQVLAIMNKTSINMHAKKKLAKSYRCSMRQQITKESFSGNTHILYLTI